jgi:parvulin-like peptidyl-prolyl isomerase
LTIVEKGGVRIVLGNLSANYEGGGEHKGQYSIATNAFLLTTLPYGMKSRSIIESQHFPANSRQGCVMGVLELLLKERKLPVFLVASVIFCLPLLSQTSQPTASASADEITLQIIVVGSAEEAQQIRERVKKGESFLVLAKEKSADSTAEDGGRMGTVSLSMLRPELRDALRGVAAGQLSEVVRTPLGYAILEVFLQCGRTQRGRAGSGQLR